MIATEIAKQIKTEKIILISSIKSKEELPFLYRLAAFLNLNKFVPQQLYKQTNLFIYWLFGAKTKEDKNLLKAVLQDMDLHFVVWAVNEILNWKNKFIPNNLFRIHGSGDKLLPIKESLNFYQIKNGSHLMVLNKADEVSAALKQILN